VLGCAPVAELEAPPAAAGDLGNDALDAGAVFTVVLAEAGLGGPVRPGAAQQRVVLVQVKGAAVFGGRAPLARRAVMGRVTAAGQVTVPAFSSTVKPLVVNPPSQPA
jgi:hypothetical protein